MVREVWVQNIPGVPGKLANCLNTINALVDVRHIRNDRPQIYINIFRHHSSSRTSSIIANWERPITLPRRQSCVVHGLENRQPCVSRQPGMTVGTEDLTGFKVCGGGVAWRFAPVPTSHGGIGLPGPFAQCIELEPGRQAQSLKWFDLRKKYS